MSGAHRHRPAGAHQQRPVVQARRWEWREPSTGRHRLVRPNLVAGLAWPGEATQRLWVRQSRTVSTTTRTTAWKADES